MTPLSSILQIRFPATQGPQGAFQLIINRPGTTALNVAATSTLLLSDNTDYSLGDYSPFLLGDIDLSKKFTTTKGRRALDAISVAIRDSYGYSGSVNGIDQAENFKPSFLTFCDEWFTGILPYKAFILWLDKPSPALPIPTIDIQGGWIDPTFLPCADPDVTDPGTANQIWLGTRTIQIIAMSAGRVGLTWQNVLQPYHATLNPNVPIGYTGITSNDCVNGTPYNGFAIAPPLRTGAAGTRDTIFGSGTGQWMQGVPFRDFQQSMQVLDGVVWPSTPWINNVTGQLIRASPSANGVGYTDGDTLTLTGGAVVIVAAVFGLVSGIKKITNAGAGYTSGNVYATTGGTGTGCAIKADQVGNSTLYGPSGYVFISIGTVLAKIAEAQGMRTFTPATDLVSALDYFAQKADDTNQNYPIDPAPKALTNIYISLGVFAKCHLFDGSYWDNPLGFSPDTQTMDVVTGLCNFLLSDYNEVWQTSGLDIGKSNLTLKAMGATPQSLPSIDVWPIISVPTQEDNGKSARTVTINNKQDNLKIICPSNVTGDSVQIEIPLRLHRIAATSGFNLAPDPECLLLDASKKDFEQALECFQVAWIDDRDSSNYTINPNCWKSLACAFWYNNSNTNVVYSSNWSPFPGAASWAFSFYAINACYASGQTPPANLQGQVRGGDYFNSRCYHAVAFAALTLSTDTIQTYEFSGVSDATGSIQNITAGIAGTWRLSANPTQAWRGVEVKQSLRNGSTTIKFQTQSNAGNFPALTDLSYAVDISSGGTSSSTGGGTSSSSGGSGNNPTPSGSLWPYIPNAVTGAGTVTIPGKATINECADNTTTGVSVAFGLPGDVITIYNRTGATFTTGDFKIPDSEGWTLMFLTAGVTYNPLAKAGWFIQSRTSV